MTRSKIPKPPASLAVVMAAVVAEVLPLLAPGVVRIRWDEGEDWTGGQALFVRVLLADSVVRTITGLTRVSAQVQREISIRLEPWVPLYRFQTYYNYRSASEQARMKCPEWE